MAERNSAYRKRRFRLLLKKYNNELVLHSHGLLSNYKEALEALLSFVEKYL